MEPQHPQHRAAELARRILALAELPKLDVYVDGAVAELGVELSRTVLGHRGRAPRVGAAAAPANVDEQPARPHFTIYPDGTVIQHRPFRSDPTDVGEQLFAALERVAGGGSWAPPNADVTEPPAAAPADVTESPVPSIADERDDFQSILDIAGQAFEYRRAKAILRRSGRGRGLVVELVKLIIAVDGPGHE